MTGSPKTNIARIARYEHETSSEVLLCQRCGNSYLKELAVLKSGGKCYLCVGLTAEKPWTGK